MDILRLRGIGVSPGIAMGEVALTERVVFTSPAGGHPGPPGRGRAPASPPGDREDQGRARPDQGRHQVQDGRGARLHLRRPSPHPRGPVPSLRPGEGHPRGERPLRDGPCPGPTTTTSRSSRPSTTSTSGRGKSDVTDVLTKIYRNLDGEQEKKEVARRPRRSSSPTTSCPPRRPLRLSQGNVLAVALDMGGPTSHAAILARSLDIPTVVGLHDITPARRRTATPDRRRDGRRGHRQPAAGRPQGVPEQEGEVRQVYRRELRKVGPAGRRGRSDGVRFVPMANIELPEEIGLRPVLRGRGRRALPLGVHLPRRRSTLPTEEEHFAVYARLAREAHPRPVYIRTIDIGGDKSPAPAQDREGAQPGPRACGPSASRSGTGSCSGSSCGPSSGPASRATSGSSSP